jgi:hypothetical protein
MSRKLHFANTFFEKELEEASTTQGPLSHIISSNPILHQLQFLPFLYAEDGDLLLVSDPPSPDYLSIRERFQLPQLEIVLLDEASTLIDCCALEVWGHSFRLAQWASERGISCLMPPWDAVRKVNSKVFSFLHSPQLPHAALLHTREEVESWLKHSAGRKRVIKSAFGLSGRGHFFLPSTQVSFEKNMEAFLLNAWKCGCPAIGEPWVDRMIDFSTQWVIAQDQTFSYIGATLCKNDERGQYRASCVGDETTLFQHRLPFFETHQKAASDILSLIASTGYFGHVGIDAMVFIDPATQSEALHPIVEINARKTMGWVALTYRNKHYPKQQIELHYASGTTGLLPSSVIKRGNISSFQRNVHVLIR